jgi:hypothetical protein
MRVLTKFIGLEPPGQRAVLWFEFLGSPTTELHNDVCDLMQTMLRLLGMTRLPRGK